MQEGSQCCPSLCRSSADTLRLSSSSSSKSCCLCPSRPSSCAAVGESSSSWTAAAAAVCEEEIQPTNQPTNQVTKHQNRLAYLRNPELGAAAVAQDVAQHYSLAVVRYGHPPTVHIQSHHVLEARTTLLPNLLPPHEPVPELVHPAVEEDVWVLVAHLVELLLLQTITVDCIIHFRTIINLQHDLRIHTDATVVLKAHGLLLGR